jgi:magnesium chelatase family protein
MSIAVVSCRAQIGLYAPVVQVEVSLDCGLPVFNIVGLPATVVKESKDRVRAAIVNSHFEFPAGRIIVNLSPADIPKRGGRFDLPIALGILLASGQVKPRGTLDNLEFYGELGLNGELKPVQGMLLVAAHAFRVGHAVVIPRANADEVRVLLSEMTCQARPTVRAADHLVAVCAHLDGRSPLPTLLASLRPVSQHLESALDLKDIRGQVQAKRALTIAAAGGHSVLMMGPPGAGKSMLAMRLPTLLPPLTASESLEVAAIASASGRGFTAGQYGRRPVRMPHHTASAVALVGGGSQAGPGEISLAHHGVLFLDELLEYDRRALEALREPLESGVVTIARASVHAQYPAQFQLIAAMNPCPCGRFGDPHGACRCTPAQITQYRGRVSGPLMERFDIHLEVPRVELSEFEESALPAESSAAIAARVMRAREAQVARQGGCNARLSDSRIEAACALDKDGREILDQSMKGFGLSARARQRILKVARTIADLSGAGSVGALHVSEAVAYRAFDRRSTLTPELPQPVPPAKGKSAASKGP